MENETIYYGFDIGGTKIELCAFNRFLSPLWHKRVPTPANDYIAFLKAIVTLCEEADNHFGQRGVVGIGIPGLVDSVKGEIFSGNLPCTQGKPLFADIASRLGRDVRIENDANCFALSEAWRDDLASLPSIFGIILGTGVGGALVINGAINSGLNNLCGEWGHMVLPANAQALLAPLPLPQCSCGREGCVEPYLSGKGFSYLYQLINGDNVTSESLVSAYYDGDEKAKAHVDLYLELLARSLATVLTVVDPHAIVIGGGLSAFDALYDELPKRLAKYLFPSAKVPLITKARYGDAGGVRGAALLNMKRG